MMIRSFSCVSDRADRVFIIFILAVSSMNVFPVYPADNNSSDKATDLSGRKYEEARPCEAFNDLKKIERNCP